MNWSLEFLPLHANRLRGAKTRKGKMGLVENNGMVSRFKLGENYKEINSEKRLPNFSKNNLWKPGTLIVGYVYDFIL